MTSPRRSKQKSTSTSGMDTRSGFRKRSKSRSNSSGQTSVMPQRVGHQRAGRRAAARSHRDAAVARRLDEVGGDQEVAGVAGARDDVELVVEPLLHLGAQRSAVALLGARRGQLHEVARSRCARPRRQRERRHVVLLAELHVHRVGDRQRVLEHVGAAGKVRGDLGGALEVQAVVVAHAVAVAAVLAEADAQQHVVRVVILVAEEVRVVGGHHRQAERVGQGEDLGVEPVLPVAAVRLHFEVVAVLEQLGVPGGDLGAPRRRGPPAGARPPRRPCTPTSR